MKPLDVVKNDFPYWEKTKDLVDQLLDIMFNYRQSGHPGGSRSKVHAFIATTLSGAMRWDIRNPGKPLADRFVLGAGHTVPLVYATLAVYNEALKLKYARSKDSRYLSTLQPKQILYWEDLLGFRYKGGLSGHAEASGKTLFLKYNTGPTGHGTPAAAGIALALKRAGATGSKVFLFEGEGGLTAGATHETLNSAWGLALDNLYFMVDWNNYGIDDHKTSEVIYGTPEDWFAPHGWRVFGAKDGSDWDSLMTGMSSMMEAPNPNNVPSALWFRTRKGRGYGKFDNISHGAPHAMNCELFWKGRKEFAEKYGTFFTNMGGSCPNDSNGIAKEFHDNLKVVMDVLAKDTALVDYLAGRLVELGDSVPSQTEEICVGNKGNPFSDERLYDFRSYPEDLWAKPGAQRSNRAGLATWGSWANAFGKKEYDRPLFLVSSADLAGSTSISGFGSDYQDVKGYGWYERVGSKEGIMLPQEITEFSNAGIMSGIASVNMSQNPENEFEGFWTATSTYGSFSYLLYGPFRLFSQMAQDSEYKMGKILWIAGHSGPETAEDSRTHFGIFSPGVTQLFPKGKIINLHPWEYNEVPVLLAVAMKLDVPLVALHLTRPNIEIPDRQKIGMDHHFAAAKGAYLMRDYEEGVPHNGVVIVQGTGAVSNMIKVLPLLQKKKLNVKIIVATSAELFERQDKKYRDRILSPSDQINSMIVTTSARKLMQQWMFNPHSDEYALSPDWDNNWRTGGRIDEVLDESQLSPKHIIEGIERFVNDREKRYSSMSIMLEE